MPINRFRKGVVLFATFFFFFILYNLFITKEKRPILNENVNTFEISTDICLSVSPAGPINADSIFNLKNNINELFAYSLYNVAIKATDTVWHNWYHGSNLIKREICINERGVSCYSSIPIDGSKVGEWSVDVRQGEVLLDVKQFIVINKNKYPAG